MLKIAGNRLFLSFFYGTRSERTFYYFLYKCPKAALTCSDLCTKIYHHNIIGIIIIMEIQCIIIPTVAIPS